MFRTQSRPVRRVVTATAGLILAAGAMTACSGGSTTATATSGSPAPSAGSGTAVDPNAPETLTPGDIPDNQAFVPFTPAGQPFTVSVPEGWARTGDGPTTTTFTDKLNAVTIDVRSSTAPPTVVGVQSTDLPPIEAAASGYQAGTTSEVTRTSGPAILSTYRADAAADPVTGKVVNDDVERYVFYRNGTEVVLTLAGPHGADNVDPWKIVTDSFAWS
ncbi:MAG: hypothetical protein LH477_05815 [Nocardioides sp.]|nr:hypothetical protein [Nocardioides sp.]